MGTKSIKRTRKAVESMMSELGSYVKHAYKSGKEEFMKLHELLSPHLEEQFGNGERLCGATVNGNVPSVLRLSAAIRYFCGGSIYDIMLSHGLGKQTVRKSIYGVINAVNKCPELAFNENGAAFPSHKEQFEIAEGFKEKSAVDFDKIILALDGMLVWTKQPTAAECEDLNVGERLFHCYRKDKFGMLLMAGCDHKCKFRFADIRHPGVSSDYTAWVTSCIGLALEDPDQTIIAPGYTIAGDGAFVENATMSIPIPGKNITDAEDAYNFYLSQIRITIERAFGILVHRFGCLRGPLLLSIKKVPALVMCLMRLHNFYIDNVGRNTEAPLMEDEVAVQFTAWTRGGHQQAVSLNSNRVPEELLGSGHHRNDQVRSGKHSAKEAADTTTPMRKMMKYIADNGFQRPNV
jgi:hypothetical protein